MGVFHVTTKFVTEECNTCCVSFAVTEEFQKKRLEVRGPNNPFYCPNGHKTWYIGKSDADVQRERAEKLQQQLLEADNRVKYQREQREVAERQAAAARGQVTKLRRRAAAGTCPCCAGCSATSRQVLKRSETPPRWKIFPCWPNSAKRKNEA